jgi:hypothetical protein
MASTTQTTELSTELALFEESIVSDAIISKSLEPKHPITSITDNVTAPIEFSIDASDYAIRPSGCFIALNISLIGERKTAVAATTEIAAHITTLPVLDPTIHCAQINNIGHSIFSKITTLIEGREISSLTNYPYIAYINTRLNFSKTSLDSYARLGGWYNDNPQSMDSTNSTTDNSPLRVRKGWWNTAGNLNLIICPFSPALMLDKIIIPQTNMTLRLERVSNPKFYLQYPNPTQTQTVNYQIKVNSAIFYTQRLELTPEYSIGLEKMLRIEKIPIIYHMTEPQVLTYNVPAQLTQFSVNNLFNGSIPEKILIMFVDSNAFTGSNIGNPFNFVHADVRKIGLYKNGIPFPQPAIDANFTTNETALAYHNTLTALQAPSPVGPYLTLPEFTDGTTIFAFDTSPDSSGATQLTTLANRTTNIRLEVAFNEAPAAPLVCLVYFERELRVAIDYQRNVTVETLF